MVLLLGPGHGRGPDREGGLHLARSGPRGAAQLQRRRVRLLGAQIRRWPTTEFTLPERREIKKIALSPARRPRPALFHLEPVQAGRVPRRRGGGRRHQPRGPARAPPRGGRLLSSDQDLEAVQRSGLRGQEEPGARALRHRRRQGQTEEGDPTVVICMDEFGPLNLLPRPGKQWAPMAVKGEASTERTDGAVVAGPPTPARRGSGTSWPPTT